MNKSAFFLCILLLLFIVACGDDPANGPGLTLASLTVSSGTLSPAFGPTVTAYMVNVSNAVANITVAGTAVDTNNIVSYDPVQPVALTVGSNLIKVRVTAADGSATNAYRVVVMRSGSDNANLASLSVAGGTLSPGFDTAVTAYSLASYVSNTVTEVLITAAADHTGASVSYPAGTSLTIGSNQLVVRVTAEDGTTTKDYTIRVYRMGADYSSANIGTLKYVPAGFFQWDASPANISFVSALHMSSNEITRSQYSTVMGADPANTTYSTGTSDPVQKVNWYHAIAFCNKLSIAEGLTQVYTVSGVDFNTLTHADVPTTNNCTWNAVSNNWAASGYRLPTEMEWMWAAMGANMGADPFAINTGGYGKAFAGSDGTSSIGDYAWYGYNYSGSATTATTTVVGSKLPNELGLSDMSGNISEWCWDWYGGYPAGYQGDYKGAASGTYRVSRGGSWNYGAFLCAVAYRDYAYPYDQAYYIGFRVVRL